MIIKCLLVFIASASALTKDLRLLFPSDRQYMYEITASSSAGTLNPHEEFTSWTLEGRLLAQVLANESQVRFQLDELKTSVTSKHDGYISYQLDEEAKHLKLPWIIDYYKDFCLVEAIYLPEEPGWVSNFKRALSLNFQLKKGDGYYTSYELCVHDYRCFTTYMSSGQVIKKYTSLPPTAKYGSSWKSVPWTDPVFKHDQYLWNSIPDTTTMTTEREYKLDEKAGLISMDMSSKMLYRTENHQLFVNTQLKINYESELPRGRMDWPKLIRSEVKHAREACGDPSCGIRETSQGYLKNRTYEILLNISKRGIEADDIISNPTMIHSLDFINLLDTMSQLNYTSLRKLFEDLVLGTSYDLETSRNIFLEVLPYAGTDAAVRFVKFLVIEEKHKIEDSALLALIRKLPFSPANYSQELLQELELFTKLGLDFPQEVRHAAILSFSTLVFQAKSGGRVSADYFDNMVVKYLRMYVDCPHYMDRLVWLQGLCNIGYSAQKYTMEIFTDPSKRRNERLWTAFASNFIDNQYHTDEPLRAVELLLPVLTNPHEDTQIRMAAVHVFLTATSITQNDFMFVHQYIMGASNPQLKRFWITAVKSLQRNRSFEGYKLAAILVPLISDMVFDLDNGHWATNNIVLSSDDPTNTVHLLSMADDTGLPSFGGVRIATAGKRASVYIVAEGMASNIYKRMHPFNGTELNVENLINILSTFYEKVAASKKTEEVHVDFVFKIQEKAVFVAHMNQTRFDTWTLQQLAQSINEFLHLGSHINQQTVHYPTHMELVFPNELGIPVRLRNTAVTFMSVRGNLTAPSIDLHIRYQGASLTSMSTYGLLVGSEHSARVHKTMVAHLPVAFNVSTDSPVTFMWPNLQKGGIVLHTRTQVEKNINNSADVFTVRNTEYQENDTIFFDCDNSTYSDIGSVLTANEYFFLKQLQPLRLIFKGIPLLISPPSTSCGIRLPLGSGNYQGILAKLDLEQPSSVPELVTTEELGLLKASLIMEFFDNKDTGLIKNTRIFDLTYEVNSKEDARLRTTKIKVVSDILNVLFEYADVLYDENLMPLDSKIEGKMTLTHGVSPTQVLSVTYNVTIGDEKKVTVVVDDDLLAPNYQPFNYLFYSLFCGSGVVTGQSRALPQELLVPLFFACNEASHKMTIDKAEKPSRKVTYDAVIKDGVTFLQRDGSPSMLFDSPEIVWLLDTWITMKKITNYGIYKECRYSGSTIHTLHDTVKTVPSKKDCEKYIALADCTAESRFAIFRRYQDNLKLMAYEGGNAIIAKLHKGTFVVRSGHLSRFRTSEIKDGVKITLPVSGVQIYYKGNETIIRVPNSHLHAVCGECTRGDITC